MGLLGIAGGELNFALSLVPSITENLLSLVDTTLNQTRSMTYQKIGKFNESVLPENSLTGNFKFGFSDFAMLMDVNATLSSVNYTESEMRGLYNVITNATLLGVTGSSPAGCGDNSSRPDCLEMGFLLLADWMSIKSMELANNGTDPNADPTVQALYGAIVKLFCPQPSTMCFDVTANAQSISLVAGYVTVHLTKIAIALGVDGENYGVLTFRSHKEIATGYFLSKLVVPGHPDGIPVPNFVPNDADRAKASQRKVFTEHYRCGVEGKTEFTWASK